MKAREFRMSGEERLLRSIFGERVGKTVKILQRGTRIDITVA